MQPIGLKPGIYFNLPAADYHSDWAISRSDIFNALISTYDFWYKSKHNPNLKTKVDNKAMDYGTVTHMLLLQPKEFDNKYHTATNYKYNSGRIMVDTKVFLEATEAVKLLKSTKYRGYFEGGYAEVVLVWIDEESGLVCRSMVDYLLPFGGTDYKSSGLTDLGLSEVGMTVGKYGYDLQDRLYPKAINAIKNAFRNNDKKYKIYGEVDKAWWKEFLDTEETDFNLIFQRSKKPYIVERYAIDYESRQDAENKIRDGLMYIEAYYKEYDGKEPPPTSGELRVLTGYHIPRKYREMGIRNLG